MKISVIMPVYNAEKYLKESIDSILNQTFTDFEFIIINDCSDDDTEKIILSYSDDRIIYIKNETNLGVASSLNKGLMLAKGVYIARMDADDISLPDRFKLQSDFLDNNPNIAVVGSAVEFFGAKCGTFINSENSQISKIDLIFGSCLAHPSVMIRRTLIKEGYLYDNVFDKVEDYHLWLRISEKYDICSLKKVLLKYRVHENQVTQNYTDEHKYKMFEIKKNILDKLCIDYTDNEINSYFSYCINEFNAENQLIHFSNLLNKIHNKNEELNFYNHLLLKKYFRNVVLGCAAKNHVKLTLKFINKLDYISYIDFLKCKLIKMIKG